MPRKQYTIHYIYKIVNIINNKYYVGMHSTFKLEDGYFGSGKYLWHSLRKYGKENHIKEILEFLPDRISLIKREKQIVNEELLNDKLCMNLVIGGEGAILFGKNNGFFGKKLSKKHLNAIKKGYKKFSKNKEKTHLIAKNATKYTKRFIGHKHSKETKQKMRDVKRGKGVGKENSQYGTCWIYNIQLKENKKIKKKELKHWLNLGWIVGRKILW